jgi:putative copper export protein
VSDRGAAANIAEVAFRWLAIALLAAACGALLLLVVVLRLRSPSDDRALALRRRLLRVATIGIGGAILANTGLLLEASLAGGSAIDPAAILGTTFGRAWAIEQAVLVVLLVVLLRAVRSPAGAPSARVTLVGGLLIGLAGVQALTGHVATGPAQETPIRWLALTAHLGLATPWVIIGIAFLQGAAWSSVLPAWQSPPSGSGSTTHVTRPRCWRADRRFWLRSDPGGWRSR